MGQMSSLSFSIPVGMVDDLERPEWILRGYWGRVKMVKRKDGGLGGTRACDGSKILCKMDCRWGKMAEFQA